MADMDRSDFFDGIARRASNKNLNGRHVDYLMAIIDKMYETELR